MKYLLSEQQKTELASLFKIQNDGKFSKELFLNIESMMESSFLPERGTRQSVMKEKAKLLNEVSDAAKKLRLLLIRVDEFTLEFIDSDLGMKLGRSYENDMLVVNGKPAKCWDPISSIEASEVIENSAAFTAHDYVKNYGSAGKWIIEGLRNAWPYELDLKISISEHSIFIKYLAIVLKEDSTAKLVKQCLRSGLFDS